MPLKTRRTTCWSLDMRERLQTTDLGLPREAVRR
jgi:hypothetical protein